MILRQVHRDAEMTEAQEQVLIELTDRGPLTWFRLDALLVAAGFQIGPALFAEIEKLRESGKLIVLDVPNGPKLYQINDQGVQRPGR
jgi:hypothetical protein